MVVYHVTPRRSLPRIEEEGLVPRVRGGPVYLFTDFTDAKIYATRVERIHGERFSVLEVDDSGLELRKDWTLYLDDPTGARNLFATAVFVDRPISPSRIRMQDLRKKSKAADGTLYRRPVRVRPYRRRR